MLFRSQAGQEPPFATRLEAGGTVEERIRVPLPAKVRHPYKRAVFDGQVTASRKAEATAIALSIGLVPVDADCRLSADQPAYKEHCRVLPPGVAVARQIMIRWTAALPRPIEVLDYEVFPW